MRRVSVFHPEHEKTRFPVGKRVIQLHGRAGYGISRKSQRELPPFRLARILRSKPQEQQVRFLRRPMAPPASAEQRQSLPPGSRSECLSTRPRLLRAQASPVPVPAQQAAALRAILPSAGRKGPASPNLSERAAPAAREAPPAAGQESVLRLFCFFSFSRMLTGNLSANCSNFFSCRLHHSHRRHQ